MLLLMLHNYSQKEAHMLSQNFRRRLEMAVPDYQSLMLSLLKVAADGNEHTLSETIETLAQQLHLEDQDRTEESRYIIKKIDLDYFSEE